MNQDTMSRDAHTPKHALARGPVHTRAQIPAQHASDLDGSHTEAPLNRADSAGMDLLAAHVPLTLLLDLAGEDGPDSREILLHERLTHREPARTGSR